MVGLFQNVNETTNVLLGEGGQSRDVDVLDLGDSKDRRERK